MQTYREAAWKRLADSRTGLIALLRQERVAEPEPLVGAITAVIYGWSGGSLRDEQMKAALGLHLLLQHFLLRVANASAAARPDVVVSLTCPETITVASNMHPTQSVGSCRKTA